MSYFISFNLPSYSFWTTFAARAWSTTSAPSTRRSEEVWYCYRSARTACAVVARLRRCRRAVASQLCPGTGTYVDAAMRRGLLVLLLPCGGRRTLTPEALWYHRLWRAAATLGVASIPPKRRLATFWHHYRSLRVARWRRTRPRADLCYLDGGPCDYSANAASPRPTRATRRPGGLPRRPGRRSACYGYVETTCRTSTAGRAARLRMRRCRV